MYNYDSTILKYIGISVQQFDMKGHNPWYFFLCHWSKYNKIIIIKTITSNCASLSNLSYLTTQVNLTKKIFTSSKVCGSQVSTPVLFCF